MAARLPLLLIRLIIIILLLPIHAFLIILPILVFRILLILLILLIFPILLILLIFLILLILLIFLLILIYLVYLTVDSLAQLDPIRLFAFVGNPASGGASSAYSWNIKVTQLDCTQNTQLQGEVRTAGPSLLPSPPSSSGLSPVFQPANRNLPELQLRRRAGESLPRQHQARTIYS